MVEEHQVENSKALKLAHRFYDDWLDDFKDLMPWAVADVLPLLRLERLWKHKITGSNSLIDFLRPYLYGWTPV
jgi:hypothetical protein